MRVKFGSLELDSATHELRRDGAAVPLSPKAWELLHTLLAHRPRALSKAELHGAVWPDTFVSDSSLARLVSELRSALGDDAELVRTVHGFGYAFSGEATEVRSASEPAPSCWLTRGRRVVPLRSGENLIGRTPESAVFVDSSRVSRRHGRIVVSGARATVEDLGSKNGTFVDGVRVREPVTLADGARISVGPVVLTFRASADGLSTETELSRVVREP